MKKQIKHIVLALFLISTMVGQLIYVQNAKAAANYAASTIRIKNITEGTDLANQSSTIANPNDILQITIAPLNTGADAGTNVNIKANLDAIVNFADYVDSSTEETSNGGVGWNPVADNAAGTTNSPLDDGNGFTIANLPVFSFSYAVRFQVKMHGKLLISSSANIIGEVEDGVVSSGNKIASISFPLARISSANPSTDVVIMEFPKNLINGAGTGANNPLNYEININAGGWNPLGGTSTAAWNGGDKTVTLTSVGGGFDFNTDDLVQIRMKNLQADAGGPTRSMNAFSSGSIVGCPGGGNDDTDCGAVLQSPLTNAKVTGADGIYNPEDGEFVYIAAGVNVANGDTRVTGTSEYSAGTTATCPGDSDCGNAVLALTNPTVTGADTNFDAGEGVYVSANGTVDSGDTRISTVAGNFAAVANYFATTSTYKAFDADKPQIVAAEAIGPNTIQITFNEAIAAAGAFGNYSTVPATNITGAAVNGGDNTKVDLTLGTAIGTGFNGIISINAGTVTDVNDSKTNDAISNFTLDDKQKPQISHISGVDSLAANDYVVIQYSEEVDQTSAETIGNYTLEHPLLTDISANITDIQISAASNDTVILWLDTALTVGAGNTKITISNVDDAASNTIAAASSLTGDTIAQEILINEIYAVDGDEFIEFRNMTGAAINISGWYVEDSTGDIYTFPGGSSAPANTSNYGLFFADETDFGAPKLNDNGDAIRLRSINGVIIDVMAYGNFNDGNLVDNACTVDPLQACARSQDSDDSDDDATDFGEQTEPTKGQLNDLVAPTSSANPVGGTYTSAQTVTLTATDNAGGVGVDKIYFTLDGIDPTTASAFVASGGTVAIPSTKTLKFFATDLNSNEEAINTEIYTISVPLPPGGGGGGGGGIPPTFCGNDADPYIIPTEEESVTKIADSPIDLPTSGKFTRKIIQRNCQIQDIEAQYSKDTKTTKLNGSVFDGIIYAPEKINLLTTSLIRKPQGNLLTNFAPSFGSFDQIFNQDVTFIFPLSSSILSADHSKMRVLKYNIQNQSWQELPQSVLNFTDGIGEIATSYSTAIAFTTSEEIVTPPPELEPFIDVVGHWAENYIESLHRDSVVNGFPDNLYKPNQPITRAELIKIALVLFNYTLNTTSVNPYPDVSTQDWFSNYIYTAKPEVNGQRDVAHGYLDGLFYPNKNTSRAEALQVLLEASRLNVGNLENTGFYDVDNEANEDWFKRYIAYANNHQLVNGYDETRMVPQQQDIGQPTTQTVIRQVPILDYFNLRDAYINPNSFGEDVTNLQKLLKYLGHFDEEPTGFYGELTKAGLAQMQVDLKLIPSIDHEDAGYFGDQTKDAIASYTVPVTEEVTVQPTQQQEIKLGSYPISRYLGPGNVGEDVKNLQRALKDLGIYQGDISGVYDQATKDAVFAFQNQYGVNDNPSSPGAGMFGPLTKQELESLYGKVVRTVSEAITNYVEQVVKVFRPNSEITRAEAAKIAKTIWNLTR